MAQGEGKAALGGAAKGAAAGAAIGSVIPIIGTGVGAVIGGIAGGIKGFKEKRQYNEEQQDLADEKERQRKIKQQQALIAEQAKEKAKRDAMPSLSTMYSGPLATKTSAEYNQQNPSTNGTGGGNPTFAQRDFDAMSAVADPSIKTLGSLFSKPVAPPMDDIQKSLQQKITSQT